MHRAARLLARLLKWTAYLLLCIILVVGAGLATLETDWAKDRVRALIVRQANQYLTATLEIARLEGSILGGLHLSGIRLARGGEALITIDDVELGYSIRELFEGGTLIRRVRLVGLHVVTEKLPDGRWDLSALIKREVQQNGQRGPRRAIHVQSIEVAGGAVTLRSPLRFGIADLPTEYAGLDLLCSFDYEPVSWRLSVSRASWIGRTPSLTVEAFSGDISSGTDGLTFTNLVVATPQSHVAVEGRLDRSTTPSRLALDVAAERFAFQEWSGVVGFLNRIAVTSRFTARLNGPVRVLETALDLESNGGDVRGTFTIDTSAPGWRGAGSVTLQKLDLARWLSRPDDASDISGQVVFDVGMPPGSRFPRGSYAFDGSHAAFMGYEGDAVKARGRITEAEVQINQATASAYGASVTVDAGSIGIDAPYPFTFAGAATAVDLRRVPATVPVPHVESRLNFDYDVAGRFSKAFLKGGAVFQSSEFLGIALGADAVGRIDTSTAPFTYSGEGTVSSVDLHRVGEGLDVQWLQQPRYAGAVAGRFHVEGAGSDLATMALTAGGRLTRADLFSGRLADADVTLQIGRGALTGTYDGQFFAIDPSLALDDARYKAALTGSGRARIEVRDMLLRAPELSDYWIDAQATLASSEIHAVAIDRAEFSGALIDSTLTVDELQASGPALELLASGRLELDGQRSSLFDYRIARSDLSQLEILMGRLVKGELTTAGRLTGPISQVHVAGKGTLVDLDVAGAQALRVEADYDGTISAGGGLALASAKVEGTMSSVDALGQHLKEVSGTVSYDAGQATADLRLVRSDDIAGAIAGAFSVHVDERAIDLATLSVRVERSDWRLMPTDRPRILWSERGIAVERIAFADAGEGLQRLTFDGSWFPEGGGTLRVGASRVSLDRLAGADGPARYGGTLDLGATITGTRQQPIVTGRLTIVDGRFWRTPYEQLTGSVDYAADAVQVDLRLDQGPGVWLTVSGRLPGEILKGGGSDGPMDLAVASSTISLGLLEGVTDVVRDVTGQLAMNVRVLGSPKDPHFAGHLDIADAGFLVAASGARYKNGRVALQLATDRVTVETLHVEDAAGHPLDVQGGLATHELKVGSLEITMKARSFQVLGNEFGRIDIDADLALQGQFESPRLDGRVALAGGELSVDTILDRMLFQPYATAAALAPGADAIVALNPWDRIGLGIELHIPNTLRLVGDNVQVSPGTPLGLGAINLRALGDLYLYKDPSQPLYVTGSLDSVTGTYVFQGRRFDLDPSSSINFRGDLNPELYVTVRRDISSVEARVTIAGPLSEPELRLSSTPPLDPSDILSLIVFNTSTNDLSAVQRQELAVRAGTMAAGFLAAPVLRGIERTLGIDTFEIEPSADPTAGARVMIGNEIAPGLVARFSRQFGESQYNEATIEYYLSRLFRIRATFSDASSLAARSPFRRVERAGIDFLVFFSF